MQAKLVNEVNTFKRGLDPKSAMGIGRIGELERKHSVNLAILSPNECLHLGIRENALDIIQYALDLGANQLWYKKTKIQYSDPIIPAPDFSEAFVIITKVKTYSWTDGTGRLHEQIENITYKDITAEIYGVGKVKIKTSTSFTNKYEICNYKFLELVTETLKNATILKKYLENNK